MTGELKPGTCGSVFFAVLKQVISFIDDYLAGSCIKLDVF